MRLALISDIHEDYYSLKKIIRKARNRGYDQMVCLGDISGFSAAHYRYRKKRNASACLGLIRENCDITISGNHDLHAARVLPKHSDIFAYPANWYQLDPGKRAALAMDRLWLYEDELDPGYGKKDMDFLSSLPEFHVLDSGSIRILLSHYVFPNLSGCQKGFYTQAPEFSQHFDFLARMHCQLSFTGHGHVRGGYRVTPGNFSYLWNRNTRLDTQPILIGLPPVTRHKQRRGFCIFDSETLKLQLLR